MWCNSNGDTELWNPNGSGGFVGQDLGVVGTSWQIAGTGDFTGKGEDSILWRNTNGDTELWNPNGAGGFAGQDLGVVPTSWQIAGTGDFTGNGKASIVWRNANGDTELWNPNGSGGFVGEDLGVVSSGWQIAGTGDFSGSGQSGIYGATPRVIRSCGFRTPRADLLARISASSERAGRCTKLSLEVADRFSRLASFGLSQHDRGANAGSSWLAVGLT